VIVAVLNGEMLVRRLEQSFNNVRLVPEHKKLAPIPMDHTFTSFTVWVWLHT
jgi:DNA polymerase V